MLDDIHVDIASRTFGDLIFVPGAGGELVPCMSFLSRTTFRAANMIEIIQNVSVESP